MVNGHAALISRAVGQTCLKVADTDSNGNKTYRPTFAFDSLKDGLNGITIRMEGSKDCDNRSNNVCR
jgi:hypothetical protein